MSLHDRAVPRAPRLPVVALTVLALVVTLCPLASSQTQVTGIATRAVGGVSIDAAGELRNATPDEFGKLAQARARLGDVPEGLDQPAEMRKISLRRLDETIRQCLEAGKPLPAEVECLGGLLRIHYVVVDVENHDVILIGPSEPWKLDPRGAPVGVRSGRPVMLLDDLMVALRSASGPVRRVISCSIDPTPEGVKRLNSLRRLRNAQMVALGMEQQLGPQKVTVEGVPETSHYARVLVAADYRMKRIGMGQEPSPVRGLPGFMELMPARGTGNSMPRWWLAPNYEPLLRDADGLTWELRGAGVKTMTQSDFFDASGARQKTVAADAASQKWAELMTDRYGELALADPVFGQLQNCMDLAIAAALIVQENLLERAQVSLPMLIGENGLPTAEFPAAKQVPSKSVVARKRGASLIACGGVQINPWAMVGEAEQSDALASVRASAAVDGQSGSWWD
ncbi:MAG: DUF1598 domain-containing protein [Planctomycetota bacterium]|jgi:hypothetical protein